MAVIEAPKGVTASEQCADLVRMIATATEQQSAVIVLIEFLRCPYVLPAIHVLRCPIVRKHREKIDSTGNICNSSALAE